MAAKIAFGCTLMVDVTTPGTFVSVGTPGALKSFNMPMPSVSVVDVTGIDQASNYKQAICGLLEGGEIEIEYYYFASDYATFTGLLASNHQFKLTVPGSATYVWQGFIQTVGGLTASDAEDKLMYKFKVHVNSGVTIGAVS